MWKLIYYEWKKLLKSKTGILLLIAMFCTMGYQIKTNWESGYGILRSDQMNAFIQEQKTYDGLTYQQLGEKILQYDQVRDSFHLNPNRKLQEKSMRLSYGDDWKTIVDKYEKGTLTQKDIKHYDLRNVDDDSKEEVTVENFRIRYDYEVNDMMQIKNEMYPDANRIMNRHKLLYSDAKTKSKDTACFFGECSVLASEYHEEVNQRIMAISDVYHPTTIATKNLSEVSFTNILLILIIAILLGNIFSRESSAKTDVYLATTSAGQWKVTAAKLFVAFIIGVVIPMFVPLFNTLANSVRYGTFDLNVMFYESIEYSVITPYIFTIKELMFYSLCNYLIGFVSLSLLCMSISRLLKKSYASGITCIVLSLLPLYNIFVIGKLNLNTWFPSYLLMRFRDNMRFGNELFMTISNTTIPRIWLYIGVWVIVDIVLVCWLFYQSKKHKVAFN